MRRIVFTVLAVVIAAQGAVSASADTNVDPRLIQRQTAPGQDMVHNFLDNVGTLKGTLLYKGANSAGSRFFGFRNDTGDYLGFFSSTFIYFYAPQSTQQMAITSSGVRIGSNPAETAVRLTVNGAINVTGNIAAKYQDVAEWVPSFGDPQPGTVVVLSEDASNHVVASHQAYDTRVAGVISEQPGVILGEPGDTKVQVATTGRVKVMVDASKAPIKIGDLLVTSDKPGIAMKSMPVEVSGIQMHRPGTVVGKALEPLAEGTGEILVLLSLQ